MKCGRTVMAALAVAGAVVLGAGSSPASAQVYGVCAPGYYYAAGYCSPYAPTYYPPAYYGYGGPFFYPTIGFGFGFGRGFHHFDHGGFHHFDHGGFHGGGFHGGHR